MNVRTALALAALASGPVFGAAATEAPPSIVRIELPPEAEEHQPFALPTEPENTLEIDFPWPVADWAGRGFTPDPERYAGDFVIQASRGATRVFVTPVAAQAHRVLHVVLDEPGGATRSVPIELVPAPAGLAWRKVVFAVHPPPKETQRRVALDLQPPRTRLREASPESELGMIRTLRLMQDAGPEGAEAVAAANPALSLCLLDGEPRSFGDFTLANRFAVRDATTGTLGLCVTVSSASRRRLLFDPEAWAVRVGDRVFPIRTLDFSGELEPGSAEAAFLVIARSPDGEPNRLLPDNAFEVSAVLGGSANVRPVSRFALEGFKIQ
jgi:hypothetical protein